MSHLLHKLVIDYRFWTEVNVDVTRKQTNFKYNQANFIPSSGFVQGLRAFRFAIPQTCHNLYKIITYISLTYTCTCPYWYAKLKLVHCRFCLICIWIRSRKGNLCFTNAPCCFMWTKLKGEGGGSILGWGCKAGICCFEYCRWFSST